MYSPLSLCETGSNGNESTVGLVSNAFLHNIKSSPLGVGVTPLKEILCAYSRCRRPVDVSM